MIKSILNGIWEVLVAIGEARHASLKQSNFYKYY